MLGRIVVFALSLAVSAQEWPLYHGGYENTKHSPLKQIHTGNVSRLALAWKFDTGDAGKDTEMQCNPLVRHGVMYVSSPRLRVFALDAATGRPLWRFDPHEGRDPGTAKFRHRGFNYWESGNDRRLYFAAGPWLWCLNARTGTPVRSFGSNGRIDLRENLGRDASGLTVTLTTPGVIYRDLLIIGSLVSESLPAAPGHIRAYDVRTGRLRWIFHTIPHPGEFGYETWPKDAWQSIGGANAWGGLALDEKRGIVFAPTGSATYDFYGANRHGDNLFANCLIALDAATGKRLWHFQFVRHDLWDRDLPTAPTLVRVRRNGRVIDAVAQITKSGHVWVFDRVTGESLFPYQEIEAPRSDVEGEWTAPKQVLPLAPPPFARQMFTEDIVTRRTPEAHADVLRRLRGYRNGPQFTPPSLEGTILFPGFDGGGEWGGATWDPETGLFYVNSNEMAWVIRLVERKEEKRITGRTLYQRQCASCHRDNFAGSPPEFPSLVNLAGRRSLEQVREIVKKGAGRMPGYAHLGEASLEAILAYILQGQEKEVADAPRAPSPIDLKYRLDGYTRFTDPDGYPAVAPPWGTLNALDLNRGEYRWRIPLGEIPALAKQGLRNTGSENYGGSIVTAGGLLFIGATNSDAKFRAFDKRTGELLWEYQMDAAGNATPATYMANGRQFVVIGAGGGKWGNPSGGTYYAFALPD
ncbi:MAG: PQQ-binding-like beta-propeller repeat protein [Bryobacteraceae bacterium]|nr:PQQ-binding-like beta-propeller repeat protein [Bryobacteraceae bacterium]